LKAGEKLALPDLILAGFSRDASFRAELLVPPGVILPT
jgi:hypothetical protein